MHDPNDNNELLYLNDDEIRLLYAICHRATESPEHDAALFSALFNAYDAVFAEEELVTQQVPNVFQYVMRVGDSAKSARLEGRSGDLLEALRGFLEALGIILDDETHNFVEEYTTTSAEGQSIRRRAGKRADRRVSFDDARYEETWLSEHTQSVNPPPPTAAPRGMLSLPARRGRGGASNRRARSASIDRDVVTTTVPHAIDRTIYSRIADPPMHLDAHQAQLEQYEDAFISTSDYRLARRVLHTWHDRTLRCMQYRQQTFATAAARDRRDLLVQSLATWRAAAHDQLKQRREQHITETEMMRQDKRVTRLRNFMLMRKAFTHWVFESRDEKTRSGVAYRHMLRFSYFHRWKSIAAENQVKVKKIMCKKYLAVWHNKTVESELREEQASAHHEKTLLRRYESSWFWQFCSKRVEAWHEQWIEKHAFARLKTVYQARQDGHRCAKDFQRTRLLRRGLTAWRHRQQAHRSDANTATQHYQRHITNRGLTLLHTQSTLEPIVRAVQHKLDTNVIQKALRVWQLNWRLSYQASNIDRTHILQTAWTNWNDALRCKALAQKINERLLVEHLYIWVLNERLRLFQRTVNGRLLSRVLSWWRAKVDEDRDRLADASVVFAERQRRRVLASSMLRLNIGMHNREDAGKAAFEFTMIRALPKTLATWKEQTDHARRLAKMGRDARFYFLCMNALSAWKERTTEHVATRRRDAYAHVRARVKSRLARQSLHKLHNAHRAVHVLRDDAELTARARATILANAVFGRWREQTARCRDAWAQAADTDQQKLQSATFAAFRVRFADYTRMEQQALDFKQDTDLSLLAGALRRVQWATFTATRKVESADALRARNRDQHIKQMLRHWATQTATKRSTALRGRETSTGDEPESPSLRPASRAASRSRGRETMSPSSPPMQSQLQSTPGYMRTPSRQRRAGRFRPLPTPAAFTPLAFNSSYLVTTPAPIAVPDRDRDDTEGLTPQITPFSRKLRAGGISTGGARLPTSVLRNADFGRSVQGGTNKSVRFAGSSRFAALDELHAKNS